MTVPAFPASGTPYVTPDQLTGNLWPVSCDWTTLPPGTSVTTAQRAAALTAVCMAATSRVNGYLNFPIHSVLNTEQGQGPNWWVTVKRSTGEGRMILARWPVTNIVSVQVAPAGVYPLQWTTVPTGYWRSEYPVIGRYSSNTPAGSGEGSQAILIAPSYINWCRGRDGWAVSVRYYHGWPHTSLAVAATAGATSLQVGDCTAWAPFASGEPGAEGVIYDPSGGQEPVTITAASATTGPGTLTLASALACPHAQAVMVSALPSDVLWASALYAGAEALTRGAQATVNQAAPGRSGGGTSKATMIEAAQAILSTFKKVW
jgi:hypothetical protein